MTPSTYARCTYAPPLKNPPPNSNLVILSHLTEPNLAMHRVCSGRSVPCRQAACVKSRTNRTRRARMSSRSSSSTLRCRATHKRRNTSAHVARAMRTFAHRECSVVLVPVFLWYRAVPKTRTVLCCSGRRQRREMPAACRDDAGVSARGACAACRQRSSRKSSSEERAYLVPAPPCLWRGRSARTERDREGPSARTERDALNATERDALNATAPF